MEWDFYPINDSKNQTVQGAHIGVYYCSAKKRTNITTMTQLKGRIITMPKSW